MYTEPCQTSKVERYAKIVNGWKTLNILAKSSILDVWRSCEYASEPYSWNLIMPHLFFWLFVISFFYVFVCSVCFEFLFAYFLVQVFPGILLGRVHSYLGYFTFVLIVIFEVNTKNTKLNINWKLFSHSLSSNKNNILFLNFNGKEKPVLGVWWVNLASETT